jgi:hypothetical protein
VKPKEIKQKDPVINCIDIIGLLKEIIIQNEFLLIRPD